MVAGTVLLLPSRPSAVLANVELAVPAIIAVRGYSAGVRLVRTREVLEKRTLPYMKSLASWSLESLNVWKQRTFSTLVHSQYLGYLSTTTMLDTAGYKVAQMSRS